MAGAFTHLLISEFASADRNSLPTELWQLLNKYTSFLFLGSVSPDLPYLSFIKTGNINWADVMHYEKTNSVAQSGQDIIRGLWGSKTPVDEAKLVWLLGFISHLVTDATIHPIVQAIVGPYAQHKEEHRLCELTQDTLMYHLKMGNEIMYAQIVEMIAFCKNNPDSFNGVMSFWKGLLLNNYANKNEEPHPELWFDFYSNVIDIAQGNGEIIALFRHLGLGQLEDKFIYQTQDSIEKNYPQYKTKYFDQVKLPNGSVGHFPDDGFNKTVGNVLAAWNDFYSGFISGNKINELVKNWDLDTGVDMDTQNKTVTYWS
jgi:hypothetical protein